MYPICHYYLQGGTVICAGYISEECQTIFVNGSLNGANINYHHHQNFKQCTEVVKYPEKYTPEICQIFPIQKCQEIVDLVIPYLKTGIPYPKK